MQDCKPSDTSVAKRDKFSLSQCFKNDFKEKKIQKILYASVVESLMYGHACMQFDIVYVTVMLCRYLSNLGVDH